MIDPVMLDAGLGLAALGLVWKIRSSVERIGASVAEVSAGLASVVRSVDKLSDQLQRLAAQHGRTRADLEAVKAVLHLRTPNPDEPTPPTGSPL